MHNQAGLPLLASSQLIMKTFLLLSGNADPKMVRLSRLRVFACLCITEPSSHYRMCWTLACWWAAGWLCAEPTWGQGRLQWAKANTLCWSLDNTGGPNSASEVCAGCLDCSFGLANCHAKDPDMYPCCFPTNKSSKNLPRGVAMTFGRSLDQALSWPCWSQSFPTKGRILFRKSKF